ncbi:SRPBCC family protein [Kribbella sp. DT2]|uniref:SRPBCC family protein n=1 Tax=Kribbella sp. DT2 TaxID=3393427 RepID=UPI003CF29729
MPTNIPISRSIAIDATPAKVFAFVADPRNLPLWAPGAVKSVEPSGDAWIFHNGDDKSRVVVATSETHGTVDLLFGEGPGVYTRVLPNGTGAEYQFTLFFPEGSPQDALDAQSAVVDEELATVRTHCENQ